MHVEQRSGCPRGGRPAPPPGSASSWRARARAGGRAERRGTAAGTRGPRAAAGAGREAAARRGRCTRSPAARRRRPSRAGRELVVELARARDPEAELPAALAEQRHDPLDRSRRSAEMGLVKADDDPGPASLGAEASARRAGPRRFSNPFGATGRDRGVHTIGSVSAAIIGLRPAQVVRRLRGGPGARPRGRVRRGVRLPRARTAPARRPRPRSSRATASAAPATSPCWASTRRARGRRVARADRHRAPAVPDAARAHRARDARALRRLLPRRRPTITATIDHVGLARKADDSRPRPLRRPAAPPRRRRRPDRRPRPALPRRADDRLRSRPRAARSGR